MAGNEPLMRRFWPILSTRISCRVRTMRDTVMQGQATLGTRSASSSGRALEILRAPNGVLT
jgi:hypothetical protein